MNEGERTAARQTQNLGKKKESEGNKTREMEKMKRKWREGWG